MKKWKSLLALMMCALMCFSFASCSASNKAEGAVKSAISALKKGDIKKVEKYYSSPTLSTLDKTFGEEKKKSKQLYKILLGELKCEIVSCEAYGSSKTTFKVKAKITNKDFSSLGKVDASSSSSSDKKSGASTTKASVEDAKKALNEVLSELAKKATTTKKGEKSKGSTTTTTTKATTTTTKATTTTEKATTGKEDKDASPIDNLIERYDQKDLEKKTVTVEFKVAKTNDGWKIQDSNDFESAIFGGAASNLQLSAGLINFAQKGLDALKEVTAK